MIATIKTEPISEPKYFLGKIKSVISNKEIEGFAKAIYESSYGRIFEVGDGKIKDIERAFDSDVKEFFYDVDTSSMSFRRLKNPAWRFAMDNIWEYAQEDKQLYIRHMSAAERDVLFTQYMMEYETPEKQGRITNKQFMISNLENLL